MYGPAIRPVSVRCEPDDADRLIRVLADPAPLAGLHVFGINEFTLRRGRRYWTRLVEVETPLAHPRGLHS
jgi:hypothetical protein